MNRRPGSLVAAILIVTCVPGAAQWLNVPTKGIPRTKDGKDLSGIWNSDPQNGKYFVDLAADFKPGEFPIQAWAEALTKERMTGGHDRERPDANCIPVGVPQSYIIFPFKIIQEPDLVVILYEAFGVFRQIFLDGRALPKDPNPTWQGYSVGHWDGDVLVVDTAGFNGKKWLDQIAGHPSTNALHVTERFRRRDFGHLDLQFTVDDPKAQAMECEPTATTARGHRVAGVCLQ